MVKKQEVVEWLEEKIYKAEASKVQFETLLEIEGLQEETREQINDDLEFAIKDLTILNVLKNSFLNK